MRKSMGNEPTTSGKNESAPSAPFKINSAPQIASRVETPAAEPIRVPSDSAPAVASGPSTYDQLGELPTTYQTGQIYLAARDPHWLFVYWDLDLESFDRKLMMEDEATFYLKVYRENGELVDQIRVNNQAKNWYFPINDAGVSYYVELGFNNHQYQWSVVGRSNEAFAPADAFSEGPVEFASVPFHLSFNRMLEMARSEMHTGKSLVSSLASLQGNVTKTLQQIASDWTDEQKKLLEALIGPGLVSQISLGSENVDQIFRERLGQALSENLMSPSSSEMSFLQGLVGITGAESSLFSGVGANWSGESSWSSALGSSWSAQPFGGSGEREFFMHVNAEVIFYGGTHPDATVWIDGQEIALAKDGSFRYHFKLPDGEFEVPIVAESPDGVEIRSAKLMFKRGTKRTGEVGHTQQPGYLNTPIGAR